MMIIEVIISILGIGLIVSIPFIVIAIRNRVIDLSLKGKALNKKLYYGDFSSIKCIPDIAIYLQKKVVYKSESKDIWDSPEIVLDRGYGDCDDFAIAYLNILFVCFGIKGSIIAVDSDKLKSNAIVTKSIISGGSIDHAMISHSGIIIEPQNGNYYGTVEENKQWIGYLYTFDEIFNLNLHSD